MVKMSNTFPEIRFKKFRNKWENILLGQNSRILAGGTPNTKTIEYWEPKEIPWMSSGEINKKRLSCTDNKISQTGYDNSSARWVKENSVLIALAGQGKTRGTVAINEIPLTTNQSIAAIETSETLNAEFLYQNLEKRYEELRLISSGDGTRGGLNKKIISEIDIDVPSIEEQSKLGMYFNKLDENIALNEHALDLLKQSKKGFLQKMFPKVGETRPDFRISEFNSDWEQRKLSEVTKRVRGNDGRMDLPTLTISAGSGWLDQRVRFSGNIAGKEQKNYTLLKRGQLSYNHGNSKLAKYGAVFVLNSHDEALVPRVYHSFETNHLAVPDFIEYMFATKRPDKELSKLITSGARMDGLLNINYDAFMGINISIPSVDEQKSITSFFKKLDRNIALQEQKIESLKQMKKAFLQKMFV